MGKVEKGRESLPNVVTFRASDDDVLRLQALATIRAARQSEVLRGLIRNEMVRQASKGAAA